MRRKIGDDQIKAIIKLVEEGPTMIANLLERNAITQDGIDLAAMIQATNRWLSEHQNQVRALGLSPTFNPDEEELRSFSELFRLLIPDSTILGTLESLLQDAINQDRAASVEACSDFVRDLLKNPEPTPRVIRSTPSASLARSFGIQPMRLSETAEDHAEQMKHLHAIMPQFIQMSANVFEPTTYFRYELPKYLTGFVALFEGDYRRVLAIIYALENVRADKPLTYTMARGVTFSEQVSTIRSAGRTSIVESFEDMHHARNALTHKTYEIEYSADIATLINFRDDYDKKKRAWRWEKSFGIAEFLGFYQRLNWINQYAVAVFAQCADGELRDALGMHWDPEFHEPRNAADKSCLIG